MFAIHSRRHRIAGWRRMKRLALSLAAASVLVVGGIAEPAAAASAYVSGASWDVTPTWAQVCANGTTDVAFYWAEAIVINQEIGGAGFVEGPGAMGTRCRTFYPMYASQRSYFRHYHVCNNWGACSREYYL
jgi:hypothetical protein